MDFIELSRLTNAYDIAAMKYVFIRDELQFKSPVLFCKSLPSTLGLPTDKEKAALKIAKEELEKASLAYFAAMKEYRTGLLPKGYKEVAMQVETTYDGLVDDEYLEAGDNTPKVTVVAIPEGNKELPYCYTHVTPLSIRGEIKAAQGLLIWNWSRKGWMAWQETEDFCNFTEITES